MNYLAHAYLSFNIPGLLIGNMISDFVKGKKKFDYRPDILFGIDLHRAIDDFTDFHPATKDAKQLFQPDYGLYSGALMDVVYDYFIANDVSLFKHTSLEAFSAATYHTLDRHLGLLPPAFVSVFPYMKKYNWLLNYRNVTGIERSFEGLAQRARYMSESSAAYNLFRNNIAPLKANYELFFPRLLDFTRQYIKEKSNGLYEPGDLSQ
jgi:acyl carrier protein phosphodiesterase